MGKIRRTFQFIISLAGAVAVLFSISLFFNISNLSPFVRDEILEEETPAMAVGILLCLVLFFLMVRFFQSIFARPLKSDLILNKEGGQIKVSREAIIGLSRSAIEKLDGVRAGRIDVRFFNKPEETEIDAEVIVDEMTDLISKGEEIQSVLHQSVSAMLGVEVHQIKVQLLPAQKSEEARPLHRSSEPKGPRVV